MYDLYTEHVGGISMMYLYQSVILQYGAYCTRNLMIKKFKNLILVFVFGCKWKNVFIAKCEIIKYFNIKCTTQLVSIIVDEYHRVSSGHAWPIWGQYETSSLDGPGEYKWSIQSWENFNLANRTLYTHSPNPIPNFKLCQCMCQSLGRTGR